jgi:hypothetical protein
MSVPTLPARRKSMPSATLADIQRLVDELTPLDQVRLLEHVLARIAAVVAAAPSTERAGAEAWDRFFQIGDALATTGSADAETLTAAVLTMRR